MLVPLQDQKSGVVNTHRERERGKFHASFFLIRKITHPRANQKAQYMDVQQSNGRTRDQQPNPYRKLYTSD